MRLVNFQVVGPILRQNHKGSTLYVIFIEKINDHSRDGRNSPVAIYRRVDCNPFQPWTLFKNIHEGHTLEDDRGAILAHSA